MKAIVLICWLWALQCLALDTNKPIYCVRVSVAGADGLKENVELWMHQALRKIEDVRVTSVESTNCDWSINVVFTQSRTTSEFIFAVAFCRLEPNPDKYSRFPPTLEILFEQSVLSGPSLEKLSGSVVTSFNARIIEPERRAVERSKELLRQFRSRTNQPPQ